MLTRPLNLGKAQRGGLKCTASKAETMALPQTILALISSFTTVRANLFVKCFLLAQSGFSKCYRGVSENHMTKLHPGMVGIAGVVLAHIQSLLQTEGWPVKFLLTGLSATLI